MCEWGVVMVGGVNMNPLLTQKNQTFLSFFHKMEESEKKQKENKQKMYT